MSDQKLIGRGNTADIYLKAGIVRKVYQREQQEAVEAEARNQEFAWEAGLPVPRSLGMDHIDGRPILSMEYLPGETMLSQIEREPQRLQEFVRQSVSLQISVHEVAAPELLAMSDRLSHQIQAVASIPGHRRAQLIEQLQAIGEETNLCHGDFHVQNILVSDSGLSIIDWHDATRGNPVLDACRSYLLYLGVDTLVAEMYLAEYCRQSDCDPDEVTRWLPLLAAARLSENVVAGEHDRLLRLMQAR